METRLKYVPPQPPPPPPASPERALRVLTARSSRPERNAGIPLDLDLVRALRINRSAVERRAATLPTRRTVKKEWQAAWLLRAITCMDLTTLQGDDTPTNVLRLCAKAQHPLRRDLVAALGVADLGLTVGAVCVYHAFVPIAVQALARSGIPVAAVSTGFPAGLSPLPQRIDEIKASAAAGADFIKTSTGKEVVNATLPVGVVMARQIRDYHERTGCAVGFKAAGGIRKAKQALEWLILMKEELGDRWLRADLFRLGASALLTDIERQLEHFVTGRYSAAHRHPMV